MSIRVENYIIYGLKFGEQFTNEFWKKEFSDNLRWNKDKPKDKPFFITDGMCGDYTFFGFITQLSNGWDDEEETEINLTFTKAEVINEFYKLYPDLQIHEEEIKMYFLPHWV